MPHALIVGAFGQDNPGDEALLAATVDTVRWTAGWEPVVASARPRETSERLGVEAIPVERRSVTRAALRVDALVVGGGTVFKELHRASGRRRSSLLWNAVLLARAVHTRGRPVALVGVGAAPMGSPLCRRLAQELAARSDLLVLRDDESAAVLFGLGVPAPLRVGADLTWAMSPRPVATDPGDVVAVAVSHLAGDDGLTSRLGGALAAAGDGGTRIELEPWQGSPRLGPDARIARRLAERIGPGATVLAPPTDLDDAVARATGRRGVVAMRFHGAVAAAMAGRPFLAVAHEPKLAGLARRLRQPLVHPRASESALSAGIDTLLGAAAPSASAIADEREKALATCDLLQLLLSGEGSSQRLTRLALVPEPLSA
jgi:polysaccharide pyruvyl transferase WcaK-like protein